MVPVYVPAIAAAGIATTIVGFHDVEFDTTPAPRAENAVRGTERITAWAAMSCPGVRTEIPLDDVTPPDQ